MHHPGAARHAALFAFAFTALAGMAHPLTPGADDTGPGTTFDIVWRLGTGRLLPAVVAAAVWLGWEAVGRAVGPTRRARTAASCAKAHQPTLGRGRTRALAAASRACALAARMVAGGALGCLCARAFEVWVKPFLTGPLATGARGLARALGLL